MVAMSTRKATPAPTATPMMTAIGTDSAGEKQAQLTRDPAAQAPRGLTQFPQVQPLPRGGRALHRALPGSACRGRWAGPGRVQQGSSGGTWGGGEGRRKTGEQWWWEREASRHRRGLGEGTWEVRGKAGPPEGEASLSRSG